MPISFRELEIWKKAHELTVRIYTVTMNYPSEERYGLTSQTRNSANSVAANIAEAHGRFHYADKIRVLYQARGEIEETRSHLQLAAALHYIDTGVQGELDEQYNGLAKGLNRYIASLVRQKSDQ